ncbi:HAMP domain-containing sensor histidine kinase [Arcobacteraceae bacterium]|nr:HAMP domain-containing sensor histidine kinase [Arcobacteraceae bacterium]
MFNKEGIPFFTITIPFLSVIFIAFFATSYHLKTTQEHFDEEVLSLQKLYTQNISIPQTSLFTIIKEKKEKFQIRNDRFVRFMLIMTFTILFFMILFTYLMTSIISEVITKYKNQVKKNEQTLKTLNETLSSKVIVGIKEGKRKDKAILAQSKLARMGSMINMIAHQWRQPLTELSGILMELETATRFKKVNAKHILKSIDKSDKMIEFMSNTIDDFRNFYKPDKQKENFFLFDSCKKAINLVNASLYDNNIELIFDVKDNKCIFGYPTEYSQVILNLITNARDVLVEKNITNPQIILSIKAKGSLTIVEVGDNAGGIQEENLDLIFDPYFTTKDSSEGTGLGLYISKLIIERNMGGELSVRNDNNGAIFKIKVLGNKHEC